MDPGFTPGSLEEAKTINIVMATSIWRSVVYGGIIYGGNTYATDAISQTAIINTGAVAFGLLANNQAFPGGFTWTDAFGVAHSLTTTDMTLLATQLREFVATADANLQTHIANINALTTIPDEIAYDVTTGWPSNNVAATTPYPTTVLAPATPPAATTPTSNGTANTISGGPGGATSGNGGALNLQGGVPTSGNGGNVFIAGAAGVGTSKDGGTVTIQGGAPTSGGAGSTITFNTNGATQRGQFTLLGSLVLGNGAVSTSATDGFLYITGSAGTPAGTPTAFTGRAPITIDTTNNLFYFYSNGSWRTTSAGSVSLSGITAAGTSNSINNGDNAQTWNWALTTAAKTAFKFGENTAAINGAGAQFLVEIDTIATSTAAPLRVQSKGNNSLLIDPNQNIVLGSAAVATSAIDGFLYIASMAGTPSGVPTTFTGRVPIVYDTSNDRFDVYNGAWKSFYANGLVDPGSNGVVVRTAANTTTARTITGTTNRITISNGDGTAGNPTIDIDAAYVGQTSITTLGTVTTGTWSATTITTTKGGTNLTSYNQGDLIYASAANTLIQLAKDTNATRYLSNTGTTNNPAWAQVDLTNGVVNRLPFANLTQIAGLSVLGVTGATTADVAAITGTANQVLRVNGAGTALGFGSIDLSQSATVGTSRLAFANLTQGTARSVLAVTGNATADFASLQGTAGQVLVVNNGGTALTFSSIDLSQTNTVGTSRLAYSNITQGSAHSVWGVTGNATADHADIQSSAAYQILRADSTNASVAFGSIDLSQSGAVGTSRLGYANLTQGSALSVLGVAGNATADHADIAAASDNQILRRSGTTVGFGSIDLSQANTVGVSILGTTNGGTGNANGTIPLDKLTAAGGANSINNGDNAQTWNWALTTAAKAAFTFTENSASTNGAGSQFLVDISTIASSTANPIRIRAQGNNVLTVTNVGVVTLQGADEAVGSAITLRGGNSSGTNQNGGGVTISGGNPTGSGNAGAISITAGALQGAGSAASVSITGGAGNGSTTGGVVNVTGGNGGSTGVGAQTSILGGPGGSTSGNGGGVLIQGGAATDGNGGTASITGANGVGTNRNGGNTTVGAGIPTGSGTPGNVNITGGSAVSGGGQAGAVNITGGQGISAAGGQVLINGGQGGSGVVGQNVTIQGGQGGANAGGGNVIINGGAPNTSGIGGSVQISGRNAAGATNGGGSILFTGGTGGAGVSGTTGTAGGNGGDIGALDPGTGGNGGDSTGATVAGASGGNAGSVSFSSSPGGNGGSGTSGIANGGAGGTGSNFSVLAGQGGTAGNASSTGTPGTAGAAGTISFTAGKGGQGSVGNSGNTGGAPAAGGVLNLTSGDGGNGGTAGATSIGTAGATSGAITITTGSGGTPSAGGATSGAGGAGGASGLLTIATGSGINGASATSGAGGAGGNSGGITIDVGTPGNGAAGVGTSQNGGAGGAGGTIQILGNTGGTGGNGTATTGSGGLGGAGSALTLTAGNGATGGNAGASGTNGSGGTGGSISLTAGTGGAAGTGGTGGAAGAGGTITFTTGGAQRGQFTAAGSFVLGNAAVATTATDGFLYITACSGLPTGLPTAFTGRVPLVSDQDNDVLYTQANPNSPNSWRPVSSQRSRHVFSIADEFTMGGVATGTIGEYGWAMGQSVAATNVIQATVTDHPGIIRLVTSTTSGNNTRIHMNNTPTGSSVMANQVAEFTWIISIPTITTVIVKVGLCQDASDGAASTFGTAGVWFEFSSAANANWRCYTRSASTSATPLNSGVAVTAGNWYVLRAVRNSTTNWQFFVNGTSVGTVTTNIPTVAVNVGANVQTATTAARNLDVDYFRMVSEVMGSRFT